MLANAVWILRLVLLTGVVGAGILVLRAIADIHPARVAAHVTRGGHASGWMDRRSPVASLIAILVALPIGSAVLPWVLRFLPPESINIPNRAYWLAPAQRDGTYRALPVPGADLGIAQEVVIIWVPVMIRDAQRQSDLISDWSWKLVLATVVFIVARQTLFVRHFRRLP